MKRKYDVRDLYFTIFMTIIFIMVLTAIYSDIKGMIQNLEDEDYTVCYDIKSFNETLDFIQKNCGSTYLTKRYNDNNWYVFKVEECKYGDYDCMYTLLEDCLEAEE